MRRYLGVLLLPAAAAVLVGCGSSSKSPAASGGSGTKQNANAAPSTVTIGVAGGYLSPYMPQYLAYPALQKVAQKFHTRFKVQVFPSGTAELPALLSHSVQFAWIAPSNMLQASAAGKDVEGVFNAGYNTTIYLVGNAKYKASRGSNLKAYNGGTWCYTAVGGSSQEYPELAAEHEGLKWSDQHGVAVGSAQAFVSTMQSGKCDITGMDSSSAADAVAEKVGYVVLDPTSAAGRAIFGDSIAPPLVTTRSFGTQYPALTQAIVSAEVQGLDIVKKYNHDPARLYKLSSPDFKSAVTASAFAKQWPLMAPTFSAADGTFSAQSIRDTVNITKKVGALQANQKVSTADTFNNRYVKAAR